MSAPPLFPLSAVAHQPQLTLALALLAVSPAVGGVLIRGDRGAAKSTAARALAALLPDHGDQRAPFVNLPLGATEDRVVGSLDVDAALRGEARARPGLAAQAHGGVLYIDEVNLLPDHLVDTLLDAAAMGTQRIERDGLSLTLPARFALVGSMNPEEGALRPQFLDRFGLCVDVHAPADPAQRAEIVRRRVAFERDPDAFQATWAEAEAALARRLRGARDRLPHVSFPDALLPELGRVSVGAGVRSLRADLVLHRAASALAALEDRAEVNADDLERVAPLVLAHRRDPQSAPPSPPPPPAPPESPEPDGSQSSPPPPPPAPDVVLGVTGAAAPPRPAPARPVPGRTGVNLNAGPLAVPDTLRASLTRVSGPPGVTREDLRVTLPGERQEHTLFIADCSGSQGLPQRLGAVKGALLSALGAQGNRERAALIAFRGPDATLTLPWTAEVAAARAAVEGLPTGGRTPLAQALALAAQVLGGARGAQVVLFTDGRANVPRTPGADPWADALAAAAQLRAARPGRVLVIDTEGGQLRLGRAAALAAALGGTCLPLSHLTETPA
ncbi:VWA domain-containing protein (plasmid) [Deinococcus taeanensis]|uniref:VWA domain-containing protein n=1 Tax=Deinococcus taeanensis TaxID=2737050 RepID=UPI001CDC0CAC|nr:VWA domain-containing protein [Deinococcus taeanensis]UBV44872.1 VWA domain-containing protein [Deinococcus taeanensis]